MLTILSPAPGISGDVSRRPTTATSTVIYPNVAVDKFVIGGSRGDFYLTSSRMVPYKKMHLIVEAFSEHAGSDACCDW